MSTAEESVSVERVIWYLAICQECTPVLPQPFLDVVKRDEWIMAHKGGTGHRIEIRTEGRWERRKPPAAVELPQVNPTVKGG